MSDAFFEPFCKKYRLDVETAEKLRKEKLTYREVIEKLEPAVVDTLRLPLGQKTELLSAIEELRKNGMSNFVTS